MINFNIPTYVGNETEYICDALTNRPGAGRAYTEKCAELLRCKLGSRGVFLTSSCTAALETAAMLCSFTPGDEVIMPSFTFASTANAFVRAGAVPVFVDIRPDTLNIDESKIEAAVTSRTKAIVVVHYAGTACDMFPILSAAKRHKLIVVEDAAHALSSRYNGHELGTLGDIGCFSFHETKNISMGEGGALVINASSLLEQAEQIIEKGTNRRAFLRNDEKQYTWIQPGGSFTAAELNAAALYAQLEQLDAITSERLSAWSYYYTMLSPLSEKKLIKLPAVPEGCINNGHIFFILLKDSNTRDALLNRLKSDEIEAAFHYIPLHSSPAGMKYCRFSGDDNYTTYCSSRLLRLPIYYGITRTEQEAVTSAIFDFFNN